MSTGNQITIDCDPVAGTVVVLRKDLQLREMIYLEWTSGGSWWWWGVGAIASPDKVPIQRVEADIAAWVERRIRGQCSTGFMGWQYVSHHVLISDRLPRMRLVRGL